MILHLVTDRRRLAPAADDETAGRCLIEQARFAVSAGIDVIQLREPDLDGRVMAAIARALVGATRRSRTRVVVNDRLDVALAVRADGVHLRDASFDAAHVRACTRPGFLVGRSVHAPAAAAAAGPVDYLIAGTVWATASKPPTQTLLGPTGLAAIVGVSAVPVLGIGGVQLDRAADLARTGAAGLAAIGMWMDGAEACRAVPLDHLAHAFREAFDTANMGTGIPPR